jgi:uncharacterized protein (TIGR02284 family)
VKINKERIESYSQAKSYSTGDFSLLLDDIISEGRGFNEELNTEIIKLNTQPKIGGYASGFIHKSWQDLKVVFTGKTQNALLNSCQYNEQVTQLAYKAALTVSAEINYGCAILLEKQQAALKRIFATLKKCHGVRPRSERVHAYFN